MVSNTRPNRAIKEVSTNIRILFILAEDRRVEGKALIRFVV